MIPHPYQDIVLLVPDQLRTASTRMTWDGTHKLKVGGQATNACYLLYASNLGFCLGWCSSNPGYRANMPQLPLHNVTGTIQFLVIRGPQLPR